MSTEKEVRIHGQVYRVKGDDPEKIDRVAGYVDEMMHGLLGDPGKGMNARSAILVALNIAEENLEYKDEVEKRIRDLNERVDELLSLLPG